jgi:hypothetical protein
MKATMLIEIWEWLRGYRKWQQAEAQVKFLKEDHLLHDKSGKDLHYSQITGGRLVWTSASGEWHHADLERLGEDAKYPFAEGETVTIRYNPAEPTQFYSRALSEMKVRRFVAGTFTAIAVAAMSIGYVWIKEMFGCSH